MYQVTTTPAAEPITLSDVKNHLKVDATEDDILIGVMIQAAREYVETYTGRALMEQTITEKIDSFPCSTVTNPRAGIELRFAPLKTLTSISYIDQNGTPQSLTVDTDYIIDTISEPPRIFPAYGKSWPTVRDENQAVTIVFVAGYTTASDVPAAVKMAMLLIIAKMYEQREDTVKNLPTQSKWLLDTVKIQHL